jgi:hypothetical protein
VQPDAPQGPIPDSFSAEPMMKMVMAWEEWMVKEKLEAVGTSN